MHYSQKLWYRTSHMGYPTRMAHAGLEGNIFFLQNSSSLSVLTLHDSFYTSQSLHISLRSYASSYHFFSFFTEFSNPLSQYDCAFMALLLPTLSSTLLFSSALCSYAILSKNSLIMLSKALVIFLVLISHCRMQRAFGAFSVISISSCCRFRVCGT